MPKNTEGEAEGKHTETTLDAKIEKMESQILELDGKLNDVLGDYCKLVVYAAGLAPKCVRTVQCLYSLLGVRGT